MTAQPDHATNGRPTASASGRPTSGRTPVGLPTSGVTLVTGTDTDVGKTVASAVLARALVRAGVGVTVVKPAQTGLAPGEPGGDCDVIRDLVGLAADRCQEWVRLPEPLAPTTAGRRAGIALPPVTAHAHRIAALLTGTGAGERSSSEPPAGVETVLVEGAGGVLVGLDDAGHGLLELGDALAEADVPTRFVVVARAGLGTLNHTALTCRAIRARGHEVAGLIIGAAPPPDRLARPEHLAERCNIQELPVLAGTPVLVAVPADIGADPAAVDAAARTVPLSCQVPPSQPVRRGDP